MLILALVACKPPAAAHPQPARGWAPQETSWHGLKPPPQDVWLECVADQDCAIAEIGCCDHCNGGRAVPARLDHAADVVQQYRDSCDQNACSTVSCRTVVPACRIGRCVLEPAGHAD